MIGLAAFVLTVIEPRSHLIDILFKVFSASATVGLSRNFTTTLSEPGQLVIMFMMYMGRLGSLYISGLVQFLQKQLNKL